MTFSSSSASDKHIIQSFFEFTANPPTFLRCHMKTKQKKHTHFHRISNNGENTHISPIIECKQIFSSVTTILPIISLIVVRCPIEISFSTFSITQRCYYVNGQSILPKWNCHSMLFHLKVIFAHQLNSTWSNESHRIRLRWLTAPLLLAKQTYLVKLLPFRTTQWLKIWKSTFQEKPSTEWTCILSFFGTNEIKYRYTNIRPKD